MKRKNIETVQLTELYAITAPKTDHPTNVLENVKVLGTKSKNGRTYPKATIEKAKELYEGAAVNINHPAGNPLTPRGYEERFGYLEHATVTEDGLFATLTINPKHQLAEQFMWDATHAPKAAGLSHNVTALVAKDGKNKIVEKIERVHSVDIVSDPATTVGIFESTEQNVENPPVQDPPVTSPKASKDIDPKPIDEIAPSKTEPPQPATITESDVRKIQLQVRKQIEETHKRIADQGIPEYAVDSLFLDALLEQDADTDSLLEQRKQLVDTITENVRKNAPKSSPPQNWRANRLSHESLKDFARRIA